VVKPRSGEHAEAGPQCTQDATLRAPESRDESARLCTPSPTKHDTRQYIRKSLVDLWSYLTTSPRAPPHSRVCPHIFAQYRHASRRESRFPSFDSRLCVSNPARLVALVAPFADDASVISCCPERASRPCSPTPPWEAHSTYEQHMGCHRLCASSTCPHVRESYRWLRSLRVEFQATAFVATARDRHQRNQRKYEP